jgi:hypothetical protein
MLAIPEWMAMVWLAEPLRKGGMDQLAGIACAFVFSDSNLPKMLPLNHAKPLSPPVPLLFALLVFAVSLVRGEAPKLDHLFPAGGRQGSSCVLTLGGTFEPWPVNIWTDSSEITATAQTNKNKVNLTISSNATPGPHLLRAYNVDGASAPRTFFISVLPEIEEKEPNDAVKNCQVITNLPVIINGRYDKGGDSDCYQLNLESGKTLVGRIYSYSLGSPVDPILQLVNSNGVPAAFNHDFANLDPLLTFQIETSGKYYLRTMAFAHPAAMNVNFTGSAACVYRLLITDGPYPAFSQPLGLQRGGTNVVKIHEWNVPTPLSATIVPSLEHGNFATASNFPDALRFPVSNAPEILEQEPNNSLAEAKQIDLPCAITGKLWGMGDVDFFGFQAKKDQSFVFSALSATLGFPVNAVIRLSAKEGKELAKSDIHTEAREPELTWKAPDNGDYFASISDLRKISGTNLFYRLSISPGEPDFNLWSDEHSFVVEPGKTNELKLRLEKKFGFSDKLKIEIQNLPSAASLVKSEIPASENSVTIPIAVPADASSFSGPIVIRATSDNKDHPISHSAFFNIRGADEERAGNLAIDSTDDLWLIIKRE